MTTGDSRSAMEHFPHPMTLPDQFTRETAIAALWRVAEATRGAIDEISNRTPAELLHETEIMDISSLSEQFNAVAARLYKDVLTND
jgi:hypothetical protein